MRRMLIFVCLFALSITPAIAQSDETEAWSIVERCVGEPVAPPDDWSFEGIIFLKSGIGIHGLNLDIGTPYIIAYNNRYQTFASSGTLSPDGRWFAVPHGVASTSRFNVSATWHYEIDQIIIYSTDARREIHSVPVNAFYLGSDISEASIDPVQWINNSEFVYAGGGRDNILWAVNAFTGEQWQYDGEYNPQLIYSTNYSRDNILREIISSSLNILAFGLIDSPYSEQFAVAAENRLYTADTIQERLIDTCLEWQNGITGIAFSPNGELAVSDGERVSIINFEEGTHYIAAYHEGSVFDWRVPPED